MVIHTMEKTTRRGQQARLGSVWGDGCLVQRQGGLSTEGLSGQTRKRMGRNRSGVPGRWVATLKGGGGASWGVHGEEGGVKTLGRVGPGGPAGMVKVKVWAVALSKLQSRLVTSEQRTDMN